MTTTLPAPRLDVRGWDVWTLFAELGLTGAGLFNGRFGLASAELLVVVDLGARESVVFTGMGIANLRGLGAKGRAKPDFFPPTARDISW